MFVVPLLAGGHSRSSKSSWRLAAAATVLTLPRGRKLKNEGGRMRYETCKYEYNLRPPKPKHKAVFHGHFFSLTIKLEI